MFDNYEWFKKEVYKLTQIDLNYYKEKQMRRRIDTLARKNGADSYETYVKLISTDKVKFKQFINFITINVSEFYRNPDQWRFMDKEVIPEILKRNKGQIKIWSAACSTGDEPYSLAMAFSKHVPLSNIRILATDIDDQVISSAKTGLYSAKSVENVPADLKKKYFSQVGDSYKIADEIKRCVTFKEHNLLKDVYPKDYDLILCRNVVIYFTDEAKDMIYKNFYNSLKPQGILFIGSTEQITTYRELGFERLSSFYFQKP
ncbi:MAG: protein-glutamate O-methyltransferase CheR [Agathobacter sp.]|uniref:CheR family methyltransferase n=1 Tax=Agathobacter sp. TaxID=2021311 RepID=UPI002E7AA6D7|nr:protein-glutamate O-methyltransferase CheR [Agathobacter sp.]MEE1217299.1 protein-glutamate O-methyltransferase CheR [Agathobacter sp.]